MLDDFDVKKLFEQFGPEQRLYMQFIIEHGPNSEEVEGFARSIGKNLATLQQWVQIPGFWECVAVLTDDALHRARTDIYRSLIRAATSKTPNIPAAKLLLEVLGDYSEGKTKAITKPTETTYRWMDNESIKLSSDLTNGEIEGIKENTATDDGDSEDDPLSPASSTEGISPE